MKNNINFDSAKVIEILSKLEDKRNELSDIYEAINIESHKINGENSNWEGKGQQKFYNSYKSIANNFEPINEELITCHEFLMDTIEKYMTTEENINKSIENNKKDLDVN
jgi:uncharacterized protein YukE